jgi:hypothetical protein
MTKCGFVFGNRELRMSNWGIIKTDREFAERNAKNTDNYLDLASQLTKMSSEKLNRFACK